MPQPALAAAAPEPTDALAAIRAEIDAIDDQLLALIARRLAFAADIGALKAGQPLFRPEREAALLARVTAGPVPPVVARAVWAELIGAMLAAEGVTAVLVTDEGLRLPATLRFGQALRVAVDPQALAAAGRTDVIVIARPGAALPPGCAALDHVYDADGLIAGQVIGAAGDNA